MSRCVTTASVQFQYEGHPQDSWYIANPSYIGDGYMGPNGNDSLTGQSPFPMIKNQFNDFGPADQDCKVFQSTSPSSGHWWGPFNFDIATVWTSLIPRRGPRKTSDKIKSQICDGFDDMLGRIPTQSISSQRTQSRFSCGIVHRTLTFQISMIPQKTNNMMQGIDGVQRLRAGPNPRPYHDRNIINTPAFSMKLEAYPLALAHLRDRWPSITSATPLPPHANFKWFLELYYESRLQ